MFVDAHALSAHRRFQAMQREGAALFELALAIQTSCGPRSERGLKRICSLSRTPGQAIEEQARRDMILIWRVCLGKCVRMGAILCVCAYLIGMDCEPA